MRSMRRLRRPDPQHRRQLQLRCRQCGLPAPGGRRHQVVVVSYTVTDEQGATDTRDADHHVTGTNDAPVAVADTNSGHRGQRRSPARSRPTTATSMTAAVTLSYALDAPVRRPDLNADGSYSFDAGNAAYQHLARRHAGRGGELHRHRRSTARPSTATLTITVTGTNDAPVAVADTNCGHRGHASSAARWRPTTATSMTAR